MAETLPGGPVPPSPEMPPMDPSRMGPVGAPEGQGVTEEQKQALLNTINTIKNKLGDFSANNFANKNKIESVRSSLLKQVFEKLQMAGVDLTSRESVAAFLAELQQTSPEMAANFEKAMEVLLGGDGITQTPEDPNATLDLNTDPQNIMNNQNTNGQNNETPQNLPQG